MITRAQVIKAVKIVCQGQILPMDHTDKQLAGSLKVYKGRGELHGDTESAIACLLFAGYEIEGHSCSKCGGILRAHWLKDGMCNGCKNPHLIIKAVI